MNDTNRKEILAIAAWLLLAAILLMYVVPGLHESPYNGF